MKQIIEGKSPAAPGRRATAAGNKAVIWCFIHQLEMLVEAYREAFESLRKPDVLLFPTLTAFVDEYHINHTSFAIQSGQNA